MNWACELKDPGRCAAPFLPPCAGAWPQMGVSGRGPRIAFVPRKLGNKVQAIIIRDAGAFS